MIQRIIFMIVILFLNINMSYAQQEIFVRAIDWNSNGTYILQAFNTGVIELVDVDSGEVVQQIELDGVIRGMLWHPIDSDRFAIAVDNFVTRKPTITIHHALTGEVLVTHEFEGSSMPSSFISAMAWNSDGTLLAVGMDFVNASDLKRDIEIIDAETGRTINNIVLGRSGSTSIDWSLDAEQLAVTTSDGIATVWQALRSERLYTAGNYQANMTSWSPDGDWLVAVDDEIDSVLQIWNVPNLQITALIPDIEVESIDWHPDSIFFATANSENQLTIWGVRSGTISRQMTFDSDIYALAWSPDGTRLALGTSGETIIVEP